MNARILRGSKQEIAESVAQIRGEVREAIVFVEEPSDITERSTESIFTEKEPLTASAGGADYSRETLYSRIEGE
jgi:hypothetical protein